MPRYNKELPQDAAGQKTTAVPKADAAVSEWVTPVSDTVVNEKVELLKQRVETSNQLLNNMKSELEILKTDIRGIVTGASPASTKLRAAKEPFTGTSSMTHTFSETMTSFVISNDGGENLEFTINGYTFLVRPGEVFEETFSPFKQVIITTTSPFRAYGRN